MNELEFWWALKGEQYLRELLRELLRSFCLIGVVLSLAAIPFVSEYKLDLYVERYASAADDDVVLMPLIGWLPETCAERRQVIRYLQDVVSVYEDEMALVEEIIILEQLRALVISSRYQLYMQSLRLDVATKLVMLDVLIQLKMDTYQQRCTVTA